MNDTSARVFQNSDVVFDTVYASGTPANAGTYDLAGAITKYGPQKFAFGTALPYREAVTALLRIEVSKETDAAAKDLIWSGNAERIRSERQR